MPRFPSTARIGLQEVAHSHIDFSQNSRAGEHLARRSILYFYPILSEFLNAYELGQDFVHLIGENELSPILQGQLKHCKVFTAFAKNVSLSDGQIDCLIYLVSYSLLGTVNLR